MDITHTDLPGPKYEIVDLTNSTDTISLETLKAGRILNYDFSELPIAPDMKLERILKLSSDTYNFDFMYLLLFHGKNLISNILLSVDDKLEIKLLAHCDYYTTYHPWDVDIMVTEGIFCTTGYFTCDRVTFEKLREVLLTIAQRWHLDVL